MITVKEAKRLEDSFLGGITEAQDAYEQIVANEAWTVLGYDTFTEWWSDRVHPLMRQLSMFPNRKVARRVIEQVRAEEAGLPPLQQRTQAELADLAGVSQPTVGKILGTRANPLKKDGAWRSTKGSYAIAHQRVKKLRGAATDHPCSSCGSQAAAWAYDHSDPDEFWEIVNGRNVPWSGDPDHYQAMCRPCHNKLDLDYAAHRNNQDRLQRNGSSATDLEQPPAEPVDPLPPQIAEQIDARTQERVTRPVPPRMTAAELAEHEAGVARVREIAAAQRQANTIVAEFLAAVVTVVTGCRYGEKGLVTKDMIQKLREGIDLLEGEL